jgi:hypothetical protein
VLAGVSPVRPADDQAAGRRAAEILEQMPEQICEMVAVSRGFGKARRQGNPKKGVESLCRAVTDPDRPMRLRR